MKISYLTINNKEIETNISKNKSMIWITHFLTIIKGLSNYFNTLLEKIVKHPTISH